jgi:hypothetical protein
MMRYPLVLASLCVLMTSTAARADVDFNRDIRPILSGRCFKCHGPDPAARESGLRLDLADGATATLDSGMTAVVPGAPDQSELIARVAATDEALRMPPTSEGEGLKPHEIEALREWIAEGAKYERHWSFVPPERPAVPETAHGDWVRNPIDGFISQRLEAAGLAPSPAADPHVLIRRLTLDLTGLPPTPEEVAAFVADPSDEAYAAAVDRLLHSPAYGERWARVWLDLARYADSAGYADDPPRVIWKYRDWVIDAFNQNMPFDQFTIEQIAGDLLPEPTDSQLIATAFHRNTMTNSEGGTDDEEFRNAAIVDRVNTTMQVWMAMTIGCAQCHSHKYDPITQEEYYQVFDIFNQTADADQRDESPLLSTFTPEQLEQRTQLEAQIAAAEQKKADLLASAGIPEVIMPPEGAPSARFVRIELPGADKILSLAEVQIFQGETNHALTGTASQLTTDFDGVASRAIDGNTDGNYYGANSTTHNMQGSDPWWEVDLTEAKPVERIVLWNRTDGGIGNRLNGCRIVLLDADRKPLWVRTVAEAPVESGEYKVPQAVDQWTDADRLALTEYLMSNSPEVAVAQSEIDALKEQLAGVAPITTPIYRELPADQRRKTHIQIRGNFLDLGAEVHAGVPSAFHAIGTEQPTRLDFARWLVDIKNPLTARVVVNRVWEQMFGMGLVETTEDFGMQGQLPSHPELLDWLAVELMQPSEPGVAPWDLHYLLRLMVTSATYRQSSDAATATMEIDPQNRLLSRGPRHRLAAETVRDQALAIAGLLSPKMHGPSVQPPRPVLGLTAAFGGSTDWETSPGEDRYRRGLYTRWQRTMPYPSMDAFDAPSREVCTLRRIRTNTPLQALVTLNDPVYVEAAQGLARRIMNEGGDTLDSRLEYGFLLCTSRPPTVAERNVLRETWERSRAAYAGREGEATTLATDPLGPLPEGVDPIDAAAWTVLGNILLNLDETLARR